MFTRYLYYQVGYYAWQWKCSWESPDAILSLMLRSRSYKGQALLAGYCVKQSAFAKSSNDPNIYQRSSQFESHTAKVKFLHECCDSKCFNSDSNFHTSYMISIVSIYIISTPKIQFYRLFSLNFSSGLIG